MTIMEGEGIDVINVLRIKGMVEEGVHFDN